LSANVGSSGPALTPHLPISGLGRQVSPLVVCLRACTRCPFCYVVRSVVTTLSSQLLMDFSQHVLKIATSSFLTLLLLLRFLDMGDKLDPRTPFTSAHRWSRLSRAGIPTL